MEVIFQKYAAPVFFVTICIDGRRRLLANDTAHAGFRKFAVRGRQEHGVVVGRYVLMPDHAHLFVAGPPEFDLSQWVRLLKRALTREAGCWQRGFFDHLLRNNDSYGQKWEYVRFNPVRAGLVAHPEDWPYQGEIVAIDRV